MEEFSHSPLPSHLTAEGFSMPPVSVDPLIAFVVPVDACTASVEPAVACASLKKEMRRVLPSHAVPDGVILVRSLSFGSHGKVDVKSLVNCKDPSVFLTVYKECKKEPQLSARRDLPGVKELNTLLASVVQELLDVEWKGQGGRLAELGVDSFDIVRVANECERQVQERWHMNACLPLLLDSILNRNMQEVAGYIAQELKTAATGAAVDLPAGEASETMTNSDASFIGKKRRKEDDISEQPPHPKRLSSCKVSGTVIAWRKGLCLNNQRYVHTCIYSGSSLLWTPLDQENVSSLERCPYFRG